MNRSVPPTNYSTPAGASIDSGGKVAVHLPPDFARSFRAVLKKCLAGKPKLPAPVVSLDADGRAISLSAHAGEVGLRLRVPQSNTRLGLGLPLPSLEALEAAGRAPVELTIVSETSALARWSSRGNAAERPLAAVPGPGPDPPPTPRDWSPMPPHFLQALHEAGRTAAEAPTKFAIDRVQFRGTSGALVATDSRQALIQSGFRFPFADHLTVPAVPVFAAKELVGEARIGKTRSHLVIGVGDWTVWLGLDPQGRYPDLEPLVPKAPSGHVEFGEGDVHGILDRGDAGRRGKGDRDRAVTLDLRPDRVLLREQSEGNRVVETRLADARFSGTPVALALNRTHLERLLRLGFRRLDLAGPNKPVVARDGDRTYLSMVLDPSGVVPAESRPRSPPTSNNLPLPVSDPRRTRP